ncbi:tRNA modification GTPase TrmE [Exophiala spinifera]|uniref:tRNA modification GTPase TrmE n=1 Tax=Exophiala spinifera TaxID=91928 RepID=A0A0D2B1T8_9EURO|nr:tRNA modification GTPase TrmE [Exophiala spinifera]KIW12570.1 tRNA modification GTPase TrmE [Exophiala spinifera]
MSAEQETKSTEETNIGGNLDAAGSASGAGSIGASASSKKSEERRKPKKLGQKGSANGTPQKELEADGEVDAGGDDEPPSTPAPPPKMEQQSRSKSRQASRGRGRGSSQPPSDTDSAYRSDVSQKGGRRNRNRNRGKAQAQSQAQTQGQDGGLLGGGGPLDAVDEVGETVNGVVDGAGNLVNDTAGKALSKPHEALGGLLKSKGGKQGAEGEKDEGENEQLRLRLDLNLDIEVQLKAKIHGDLTLGLLYVLEPSLKRIANVSQELVLDEQVLPPTCIYYRTPIDKTARLSGMVATAIWLFGRIVSKDCLVSRCWISNLWACYFKASFVQAVSAVPGASPGVARRQYVSSTTIPDVRDWAPTGANSFGTDTIYALSTAPGRSAIAVVRISGPACLSIYRSLCPHRPQPKPRTATLRRLYEPKPSDISSPQVLDNGALVLYFPAPHTVTGEDVLELHIHGGRAIVRSVLEAVSTCGGLLEEMGHSVRHAEPGEFTKRAFYNGRLDLTQAEALGETLAAETEQQRRLAVSGSDGGLAKRYEDWRMMLLYARGELEALIDFSEDQHFDESPVEFMASVSDQVTGLRRQIEMHLQNASKGELLRNGISIALLGAPNAGKSSLLNRIVGREAAIVSAEEGTTRDIVDVTVDLQGWLCRLGDMAGLRSGGGGGDLNSVGLVEREGIRRARERALQSDVVVALFSIELDVEGTPSVQVNEQVYEAIQECHRAGKTILLALNKVDLLENGASRAEAVEHLQAQLQETFPMIPSNRLCRISCRDAEKATSTPDSTGIQSFLHHLTDVFAELTRAATGGDTDGMNPVEAQSYWSASLSVTHRQSLYLKQCLGHLNDFLDQTSPNPNAESVSSTQKSLNRHDHTNSPHDDLRDEIDIVTAAEHLRFAADCLSKITGKGEAGDVEDVLGVVFEK